MTRAFALCLALCFATPLWADGQTALSLWMRTLEAQGYDEIEVGRTWLGRIRIEAERGAVERLIILDRATGEVLRDVSWAEDGEYHHPFEDDDEVEDD